MPTMNYTIIGYVGHLRITTLRYAHGAHKANTAWMAGKDCNASLFHLATFYTSGIVHRQKVARVNPRSAQVERVTDMREFHNAGL